MEEVFGAKLGIWCIQATECCTVSLPERLTKYPALVSSCALAARSANYTPFDRHIYHRGSFRSSGLSARGAHQISVTAGPLSLVGAPCRPIANDLMSDPRTAGLRVASLADKPTPTTWIAVFCDHTVCRNSTFARNVA